MNDHTAHTTNGHDERAGGDDPDPYATGEAERAALHGLRAALAEALEATADALRERVTFDTLAALQAIRHAEGALADALMKGRGMDGPGTDPRDVPGPVRTAVQTAVAETMGATGETLDDATRRRIIGTALQTYAGAVDAGPDDPTQ